MSFRLRLRFTVVTLALLYAAVAYAAISGVISGTATDPSGAVVPNATVFVLNEATGVKQSTVTDSKGFYSFPALDVGTYTVSTSISGFNAYLQTGIHVDANSSVRTDIKLAVGAVTTTEVVVTNAAQIETQSTQIGEVIAGQQMTAVPLNGRAFTDLLGLQPGVSPYAEATEGSAAHGGNQATAVSGDLNAGMMSVNGGREDANGFMINGGDVDDGVLNAVTIIPNLDSISEFRILTSNFDAEYGNYGGGEVNVVTKNGTNQWHGSGFEFFRNTALNARGYSFSSPAPPKGAYKQNIFGGTFGGPIRRDKTFFFADFQGTKQGIGTTDSTQVPTAADLTGNVSDLDYLMNLPVTGAGWANVLSNRLGYAVTAGEKYYTPTCGSTSQCVFPGAIIPKSAWDSVPANLFKYFPAVNGTIPSAASPTGTVPAFVSTALLNTLSDYKEAGRVDYNSHYGILFGYYFVDNYALVNPYASGTVPGFPTESAGRSQMGNIGLTTTFKNNSVNTFRFTYMRMAVHEGYPAYPLPGPSLASLGFVTPWGPAGGDSNVIASQATVPNIDIDGMEFGASGEVEIHIDNTFQGLDDYMKIVGTHTFQGGVDYHYDQIAERTNHPPGGSFTFKDSLETGDGFADFLLGAVDTFGQSSEHVLNSRSYYLGAYFQDSWRARQNLTLNYGIRYAISTPWWDAANQIQTFIPGEVSQVFPGAPAGLVFPGDVGVPNTLAPVKYDKFAPRFGFDYAPNASNGFMGKIVGGNKLVIRGGVGLFHMNFQDGSLFDELGDQPFGADYGSPVPPMFSAPYVDRATQNVEVQQFPFTFPPKNVSVAHPDPNINWPAEEPIGSGNPGVWVHDTVPYLMRYFFGIQRQIGGATVFTLNYVGSEGRHLADGVESDPGNAALCLSLTGSALAPGQTACGPNLETQTYTLSNGSTQYGTESLNVQDSCICFASNPYYETEATSNYNALEASLKHSGQLGDFLVSYTYSKSMDDASTYSDEIYVFNPRISYGLSEFNVPQYLVASYDVHLPFARWAGNSVAKQIIGGWSISGISKFAKGVPVTLMESDDRALCDCGGDEPNYTPGNLFAGGAHGDKNPRNGQHNPYFNTSLFSSETLGVYGNTMRRFFPGPGLDHTDLALLRDFRFAHERNDIQFRLEAFNFLNHAEFSNPAATVDSPSSFGNVTSAIPNQQRVLQIAVKYIF